MKAGWRVAIYAASLVLAFFAAFGLARLFTPEQVVETWTDQGHTDTRISTPGSEDDHGRDH